MRVFVAFCFLALFAMSVTAEQHSHDPKDYPLPIYMLMVSSVQEQKARVAYGQMPILERCEQLGLIDFLSSLQKTELGSVLKGDGPFTLFGITDEALEKLPNWAEGAINDNMRNLIEYMVVDYAIPKANITNNLIITSHNGDKLRFNTFMVDGNEVFTAECIPISRVEKRASNGIIHVMADMIIPPAFNGIDTLRACPIYETMVQQPVRASFWDRFKGEGPFTIFAPTNLAFREMDEEIQAQLKGNADLAEQILAYHIVEGTLCSAGLVTANLTTIGGFVLQVVNTEADGLSVNGARIIAPDTSVTNGVVHGIDTVLLPEGFLKRK